MQQHITLFTLHPHLCPHLCSIKETSIQNPGKMVLWDTCPPSSLSGAIQIVTIPCPNKFSVDLFTSFMGCSKSLDLVMEVHGLFSLFSCPAVFSFPAYYSRFFGPSCVDRRQQRGDVRELAGGDNHNNPSTFSSKTFSMKLLDCPSFCFVIFLV